jgi:hypothetical protein
VDLLLQCNLKIGGDDNGGGKAQHQINFVFLKKLSSQCGGHSRFSRSRRRQTEKMMVAAIVFNYGFTNAG